MSVLNPNNTTLQDLCVEALRESGAIGVGQTALAEDLTGAWARLQWMLQEWERKRWLVFYLRTLVVQSTGANEYTVGPGGDFDTGADSVRPQKLERAFLRQMTQTVPNRIDTPVQLLQSEEDYSDIALKQLIGWTQCVWLRPEWPLAKLLPYPVPNAAIYGLGIVFRTQLPYQFASPATQFDLPFEYYSAMLYNLALRLRPKYGLGTYPGDQLPNLARDSLAMLRGSNTAIAQLRMPQDLNRPGIYNIFNDRSY